jgi:putative protease
VFHARPQSAVQLIPELLRAGVARYRIEVVRESPDDVRRLVRSYARAIESPSAARDIWRELRTELGYGVVRGSLRVLEAAVRS